MSRPCGAAASLTSARDRASVNGLIVSNPWSIECPVPGRRGAIEYLIHLRRGHP
jgi:hypothetical protein